MLLNEDFRNREELMSRFNSAKHEINTTAQNAWEQVQISLGIAVYDPQIDTSVNDMARRADKTMYENKRAEKKQSRSG